MTPTFQRRDTGETFQADETTGKHRRVPWLQIVGVALVVVGMATGLATYAFASKTEVSVVATKFDEHRATQAQFEQRIETVLNKIDEKLERLQRKGDK